MSAQTLTRLALTAGLPRDDARRVVSEVAHQLAAADKGMHGVELMTAFGLPEVPCAAQNGH
eukprot:3096507-Rhodomonas_salina.11